MPKVERKADQAEPHHDRSGQQRAIDPGGRACRNQQNGSGHRQQRQPAGKSRMAVYQQECAGNQNQATQGTGVSECSRYPHEPCGVVDRYPCQYRAGQQFPESSKRRIKRRDRIEDHITNVQSERQDADRDGHPQKLQAGLCSDPEQKRPDNVVLLLDAK